MKISFTNKIAETDHPVFIVSEKTNKITSSLSHFNKDMITVLKYYIKDNKNSSSTFKTLSYRKQDKVFYFTIAKFKVKIDTSLKLHYSGQLFAYLEKQKIDNVLNKLEKSRK